MCWWLNISDVHTVYISLVERTKRLGLRARAEIGAEMSEDLPNSSPIRHSWPRVALY